VPEHVDAGVEVLRPGAVSHVRRHVGVEAVRVQYQADLPPVRPHVTAFHWAAWLHTGLGVPFAKVATILRTGFGLAITPGGLATLACSCATGAPYRKLPHATHQTCPARLLRRTHLLLKTAQRGATRPPTRSAGCSCGTWRCASGVSVANSRGRGLRIALDRLEAHTDRALAGRVTHAPNRRLLRHLRTERPALFICVRRTDVEATAGRPNTPSSPPSSPARCVAATVIPSTGSWR